MDVLMKPQWLLLALSGCYWTNWNQWHEDLDDFDNDGFRSASVGGPSPGRVVPR
jgi:hypothetical protein